MGRTLKRLRVAAGTLFFAGFAAAIAMAQTSPAKPGLLSPPAARPAGPAAPGLQTFRAGAFASLYIPASLKAGEAAPFLLLLHGGGQKGGDMIRMFRAEADRRGIVLLAPDSARRTWDAVVEVSHGRRPAFGEDVPRIDAAMKEAFARVAVDPKRMAVAGFSDGAGYALSLGVRNSAMFHNTMAFSAGLIVAGDTGPPSHIFISHGAKDHVLPIAISRDTLVPALKQAGFHVTFVQFHGDHELPGDVLDRALDDWLGPN
jgi:predicted esterase